MPQRGRVDTLGYVRNRINLHRLQVMCHLRWLELLQLMSDFEGFRVLQLTVRRKSV
jgi:hypothetical protein